MSVILTATNPDAEAAGRVVGQVLVLVLLLAGILKCWSISRRPTTNTKCVLGLLLLLSAWCISSAGAIWLMPSLTLRPLFGLIGLGACALMMAAVILSIIGLVEYANEPGKYLQGRAQAIWTLVLCGLATFMVVGKVISTSLAGGGLARQGKPGVPLVFEDRNFQIRNPGRPWVQVDAARLNPEAQLAFVRTQPEAYFMVIAEKVGTTSLSAENLAEIAGARMRSLAESTKVLERTNDTIGQLSGIKVRSQLDFSGKQVSYVQWFCATNGWAYQLMAWGKVGDEQKVLNEATRLKDGFTLLDPTRLSPLAGRHHPSDYASTNFQFAVHCSDPGFLIWENIDTDCPNCSFGVLNQEGFGLSVSAVNLMNLAPEPELVYRGFLTILGQRNNAGALAAGRRIQLGQLSGLELDFEGASGATTQYSYRTRMLCGTNVAYLINAWVETRHAQKDKLLSDALSRVSLLGSVDGTPMVYELSPREKRVHRMVLNAIGTAYFEDHRFDRGIPFFKESVALDTFEHETPYLRNFVDACLRAGKYREALAEIDEHTNSFQTQPALRADQAFLQARLGQVQLALTNYARLFAGGYNSEEHFREYVGLLTGSDQADRALKEVEAYLSKQDTPGIRLAQAELLKRQRKFTEAAELLKAQREKNPFHAGIIYSLGDAYIAGGKPSEALALCQDVQRQQGPSAGLWVLKGRAELGLKWYREAKDSFEKALKDAPDDPEIKNLLAVASGVLGQGANSMVKEPIDPVALPDSLAAQSPAPPSGYGREEGAFYSRRVVAVSFKKEKESRSTDYLTVRVLSPTGVSAFSTFQIGFHPLNEELYVNQLEVRDGSGILVSSGSINDYYVLDDRSGDIASGRKLLHIPVSGLQPGYRIEAVFTRREFGTPKDFSFLPIAFSKSYPVRESVVYYKGDTNDVRWVTAPSVPAEPVAGGLCWRWKDPPVLRWEPLLPTVGDYAPMLWLGDSGARWPALVTNYLDTIAPRLEQPPEFVDLCRRVTQGATNLQQKLSAIASYIQTNYSYQAIEFGRRARVPEALADIVRNKYGDCKDHAVLARQMLQAAGVPASLALVSFSGVIREDVPSLDQFDHMIVYVPGETQPRFLDCTSKSANLSAGWTPGLAGRNALVLDRDAPRFVRIPGYPTNSSVIRMAREIQFTNASEALVTEDLAFEGLHAAILRSYLRGQSASARRAYVSSQLISASAELLELSVGALEDPLAPLTFRLKSLVRGQFQLVGNQMVGTPPLGMERTFLATQPVEKRTAPFEVGEPMLVERTLTIALPAEFKPKLESIPDRRAENQFVSCRTSVQALPSGWRVSSSLYEPAARRPAQEYGEFCSALREAVETLNPRLVGERIQP